jgi:hypothetical protein
MKICFVHQGNPIFLQIALSQAAEIGLDPVVIGDETARCSPFEFVDLRELDVASANFRKIYQHCGVNPYLYEMFCYERWFIAQSYMEATGHSVILADHDLLLYPKAKTIISAFALSNCCALSLTDTAWFIYLPNVEAIKLITNYFLSVFNNPLEIARLAEIHAINGVPHLSDMHLLLELASIRRDVFMPIASQGPVNGLDNNIRLTDGYCSENGHKIVVWRDRRPYTVALNGEEIEMATIHFQGASKFLMGLYHTVSNPILHLDTFSPHVKQLPSDPLGDMIRAQHKSLTSKNLSFK